MRSIEGNIEEESGCKRAVMSSDVSTQLRNPNKEVRVALAPKKTPTYGASVLFARASSNLPQARTPMTPLLFSSSCKQIVQNGES